MFKANINYFFNRSSGQHVVVPRSYYLPSSQFIVVSADLDLTDFFYSLLCGSFDHDGIITFRDFADLEAFVASLENFCILEFSRVYTLTDFQLMLNIEHFLVQLTNSAVFLRDNF